MNRVPIFIPEAEHINDSLICGYVYITRNLVNNKLYVGKRLSITFDTNYIGSGTALLKAVNKYGKENFVCKPIEWVQGTDNELCDKEKWWISFLDATKGSDFYNMSLGGKNPILFGELNPNYGKPSHMRGKHLTEEHKMKLSQLAMGRTVSEETRQKISKANKGKILSEETKRKISESFSGENHPNYGKIGVDSPIYGHEVSEETRQKISKANKGKILSEETKRKISESHKGKTLSEETRQKISDNNSKYWEGKTFSEETRQKIAKSHKGKTPWNKGKKTGSLSEEHKQKIREGMLRKRNK